MLYVIVLSLMGGITIKHIFKNESVSKKQRRILTQYYIYISTIAILIFGNVTLISCIFMSIFIVIIHSSLRKTSLKSKTVRFMDLYNDFGPISTLIDWIHDEKERMNADMDQNDVEAPLILDENDKHEETNIMEDEKQINISLGSSHSSDNEDEGLYETSKLVSIAAHDGSIDDSKYKDDTKA